MNDYIIYTLAAWVPAGLLNFLIWKIELKVKGLTPPKRYQIKIFTYCLAYGVAGVIVSLGVFIFNGVKYIRNL